MARLLKAVLAAAVAFAALPAPALAGTIAVIVNRDNPVIRLEVVDIRRIYTNGLLVWPDGSPIVIYDLNIQSPVRQGFSESVLGRSAQSVAEEWAHLKITNQAKNPPQTVKSETLIIRRVAREKGAIGYVSIEAVKNNLEVKVVGTVN